jgi:hypothetical protein
MGKGVQCRQVDMRHVLRHSGVLPLLRVLHSRRRARLLIREQN